MIARLYCAVVFLGLIGSCTPFNSSECADGTFCPAGRTCEPMANRCVLKEQLRVCQGLEESAFCEFLSSAGQCELGACIPSECGDGVTTGREFCDGSTNTTCTEAGFDRGIASCTASCALDTSECASIGWELLDAGLDDRLVTAVWVAESGEVFIAFIQVVDWDRDTVLGGVIRVSDGSTTIDEMGTVAIHRIWGRSATEVYAVGALGKVLTFDGSAWSPVDVGSNKLLIDVTGDAQSIYITSDDNAIYGFDGQTWTLEQASVGTPGPSMLSKHQGDFYFLDPTSGASLFTKRAANGSWNSLTAPSFNPSTDPLQAIGSMVSINDELFATYGDQIASAIGPSLTWGAPTLLPVAKGQDLIGSWVSETGALFAAGKDGSVYLRSDETWIELRTPEMSLGGLQAVSMGGAQGVPVVAFVSSVARSTGSHWSTSEQSPAGFTLWAAGAEFLIGGGYHLGPGNFASGPFQLAKVENRLLICGAWGRGANDALAIGVDKAFRFQGNWVELSPPPGALEIPCRIWADATRYWVGGPAGAVYALENTTWVQHSIPNAGNVVGLSGSENQLFALTDDDGQVAEDDPSEVDRVFSYDGSTWQELFSDSGLTDMWIGPGGQVHLIGSRSYVGIGDNWTLMPLPAGTQGLPVRIHGVSNDDVFALTDQGEILHYDGVAWSPVRGILGGAATLHATATELFIGSIVEVIALSRLQPW